MVQWKISPRCVTRTVAAAVVLSCGMAMAGEIDENELFGGEGVVVDSAGVVNAGEVRGLDEKKSAAFSGEITTAALTRLSRDWFENGHADETAFSGTVTGNLMLDVRLPGGFKTFGNAEASYDPADSSGPRFHLRELFVDANVSRRVYVRAGKQVLQWGRCNFWNPTDLINIEKKSFVDKIGYREGTFGLKAHVPFGTTVNLYGFVDMHDVRRPDSLAGAAKFEFLVGGVESSLSLWDRRGRKPVYGFDVSGTLFDFMLAGEIGLFQEYDVKKVSFADGVPQLVVEKKNRVPRVCVGVTRFFDLLDVQDRVMSSVEFYFNRPGLTDRKLPIPDLSGVEPAPQSGEPAISQEQLVAFFIEQGLYEPNNFSRCYLAFFSTVSKFIVSDMTLTVNAIGNLNQRCVMATAGLGYATLHNFNLGLLLTGYFGPEKTEYAIAGSGADVRVTAGIAF